jgi:hypothetical protein
LIGTGSLCVGYPGHVEYFFGRCWSWIDT